MDCYEFEKDLLLFHEDRLSDRGRTLDEHRRGCKRCSRLADLLDDVLDDCSLEEKTLSPQFWPRLYERVRAHDSPEPRGLRAWRPGAVALAASFVLAVGVGVFLGSAYSERLGLSSEVGLLPQELREEIVPYLLVLDEVPHGSLAELMVEESMAGGSER